MKVIADARIVATRVQRRLSAALIFSTRRETP
jgi:hypothetical protein